MRILLVSSGSGSRGGGEIFLDYLGAGLAERGHEIIAWIPLHSRMDELASRCERFARVVRSEYRNTYDYKARSLAAFYTGGVSRRVSREWAALDPDVVHINKQNLEDGLDLLRAIRYDPRPCVCTIHLTQSPRYLRAKLSSARNWVARNELRKYAGTFVTVQESRRKELEQIVGPGVRNIFNGVPVVSQNRQDRLREKTRNELGLQDEEFLVVGLGRLVAQKRPFRFLDGVRRLHERLPHVRGLWVGEGELREEWDGWVRAHGLATVISCTGWQSDPAPYLAASDLLLHVAEYEGLPFAILEAMAAGRPCALTRELAREIPQFDESTVLDSDDISGILASIVDEHKLRRLAMSARELVCSSFSDRSMVASYEGLYREAAAAK